jgi:ABC-type antimicrobial peptide transport system permease subunit
MAEHPSDTAAILISRQGVLNLHYNDVSDIIGETILVQEKDFSEVFTRAEVIGVFEDYKRTTFFSTQKSIRKGDDIGIVLTYGNYMVPAQAARKLSARISSPDYEQALQAIQQSYTKLFPGNPFNWTFLDDNINSYYENEKIARNQIVLFSVLVIAISGLGLMGMMMQRILQKTKEIGVRKVLGARTYHIGAVLLDTTIRQMAWALLIGVPISWYATQQYLERFSVRIDLNWWHYLIPVIIYFVIMLLAISRFIWRAASRNPVESLRYE